MNTLYDRLKPDLRLKVEEAIQEFPATAFHVIKELKKVDYINDLSIGTAVSLAGLINQSFVDVFNWFDY